MAIPATQERRGRRRYRSYEYTAMVSKAGLFGKRREPVVAAMYDFNRFGMSFKADEPCKVGEQLLIDIESSSERLKGLQAEVCHVAKEGEEYHCGLQFLEAKERVPSSDGLLAKLEQVIRALRV